MINRQLFPGGDINADTFNANSENSRRFQRSRAGNPLMFRQGPGGMHLHDSTEVPFFARLVTSPYDMQSGSGSGEGESSDLGGVTLSSGSGSGSGFLFEDNACRNPGYGWEMVIPDGCGGYYDLADPDFGTAYDRPAFPMQPGTRVNVSSPYTGDVYAWLIPDGTECGYIFLTFFGGRRVRLPFITGLCQRTIPDVSSGSGS